MGFWTAYMGIYGGGDSGAAAVPAEGWRHKREPRTWVHEREPRVFTADSESTTWQHEDCK